MQQVDCRLNATQICNAAGLNKASRQKKYMKILRSRCVVTRLKVEGKPEHSWVPFEDGVFLCQALKLCNDMKPLLSQASLILPSEVDNYFLQWQSTKAKLPDGYKALQWDDKSVVYMPSARKVHAGQLLRLGDVPHRRAQLAQFFSHNHEITKAMLVGHRHAQGTYIGLEDARLLCHHFHLSEGPVDEIIRRERATEISVLGVSRSASQIFQYEGTYDFYKNGTSENGNMYQGHSTAGLPGSRENGPATPAMDLYCNDSQVETQHADPLPDPDHYSQFTEPNYEYGSYLAPADQSYLQLVNNAK